MPETIHAVVLGATGYASGEALRLLGGHPNVKVVAALSRSAAGQPVASVFPHLAAALGGLSFSAASELKPAPGNSPVVIIGGAPHGASAAIVSDLVSRVESAGREAWVVDMSADFRHRDSARFEAIYGTAHSAPEYLSSYRCGLPELCTEHPGFRVAHPGCFTTAVTLAAAPFFAAGMVGPTVRVSAVTGSTGSGRTPTAGTHHPHRNGNLWAYKPLRHRHAPEMETLLNESASGSSTTSARVHFVPHSGPFARGIHATVFLTLTQPTDVVAASAVASDFYAGAAFVSATESMPSLKEVVGTNHCRLGIAVDGDQLVVTSMIDNLIKGAAGGAVQWLNRMAGLPDDVGLAQGALPWT